MMALLIFIPPFLFVVYWLYMSPYSQVFGKFPYKARTSKKQIALTFDDGPNEPYTSQLLDYLDAQGVKATFFQVGKCVERFPEVTKRIASNGHLVGNHSLSHSFPKYFTEHSFENEINQSQRIFKNVLGKSPVLFRPPWLWRYPKLFKTLKAHNLQPVSGQFCSNLEVFQPSAQRIAKATVAKAKPGAFIIFHDGFDAKGGNRGQTVEAVKLVVKALRQQGYEFVTADKLLGIQNPYQ